MDIIMIYQDDEPKWVYIMIVVKMTKTKMKTSPSSLSMEARVLATSSESRLSTSLGDLGTIMGLIIEMVAMEMMIEMVTMGILNDMGPGYCGTVLPG